MVIKDDESNQNTIVADYNALISRDKVDLLLGTFSSLLNLPASAVAERNRMLFVEPAGGAPGAVRPGLQVPVLRPAGDGRQAGRRVGGLADHRRARERAAEDGRLPDARRPVRAADVEGIEKILAAAGIKTVYRKTYTIDNPNFDAIANAVKAADAELVVNGATFEDGVGMVRALRKANYTPEWFYQTTAPSLGDQYARPSARGPPRGSSTR